MKYNFNGPNNLHNYWCFPYVAQLKNLLTAAVLVWAYFELDGKTNIVFIERRSKNYHHILENNLLNVEEQ